ncbi:hypothetical protein K474DRAFT_1707668 [Panus rudis PR-1116 ss-1]|nr:hypothetical protein K474DRAFT_1707668 [Panus rudis PR-1116 ss-1]
MKSFAVVSVFASVVLAQSSSLIPAGVSQGCATFLTSLNNDASLASCTGPIINATAILLNSTTAASPSTVSTILNTVCGGAVQCDEGAIRSKLADFYTNCNPELTSQKNDAVVAHYDALYAVSPLRTSICSKDDSGAYCATRNPTTTSVSSLYSTTDNNGQKVFTVNRSTFLSSNLAFLFLNSGSDKDHLCSACSRQAMTAFVSWESNSPYAPGIAQSGILAGQSDLYNAIQQTCGANFLQGAVQAAGSLSDGVISGKKNGAARSVGSVNVGGLSAFLGAVTVLAAVAL